MIVKRNLKDYTPLYYLRNVDSSTNYNTINTTYYANNNKPTLSFINTLNL